jgi:hypothetical protein
VRSGWRTSAPTRVTGADEINDENNDVTQEPRPVPPDAEEIDPETKKRMIREAVDYVKTHYAETLRRLGEGA